MVSAIKMGGKKLYELARKGVEVQREPRPINIGSITVNKVELPYCDFVLECSKGTYVRSLCHDVGAKLGCGGTLTALRRLSSGSFDIKDAGTVDILKELDVEGFKLFDKRFGVRAELCIDSIAPGRGRFTKKCQRGEYISGKLFIGLLFLCLVGNKDTVVLGYGGFGLFRGDIGNCRLGDLERGGRGLLNSLG
jgi:tRNA U55 pseudouridine synthase TruB